MMGLLFHPVYGIAPGGRGSEAIVRTLVGVFELSVHGIPRSMSVSRLREIGFVVDVQGFFKLACMNESIYLALIFLINFRPESLYGSNEPRIRQIESEN
jgi:hypothetical protein